MRDSEDEGGGEEGGQTECEGCCARVIGQISGWAVREDSSLSDTALHWRRRYDMESGFTSCSIKCCLLGTRDINKQ